MVGWGEERRGPAFGRVPWTKVRVGPPGEPGPRAAAAAGLPPPGGSPSAHRPRRRAGEPLAPGQASAEAASGLSSNPGTRSTRVRGSPAELDTLSGELARDHEKRQSS